MKIANTAVMMMFLIPGLVSADNQRQNHSPVFGQINQLRSQVEANTNNLQQLSEQVENLSGGGTDPGLAAQVQSNTTAINNLTTQVQSHSSTINNHATQIQANTDKNTAQDASIQANTDKNTAQDASIQANSNASAINSGAISGLQSNLDNLSLQVQANTSNIDDNSNRITALENSSGGGTNPPPNNSIDFLDYIPVPGIKEYQEQTSSPVACSIIRHEISRTDNANDSDISIREIYTNGSVNCTINDFSYKLTEAALSLVSYKNQSMFTFINLDMPGDVLNDSMMNGQAFGFASANVINPAQMALQTNTVLGIESITVPAGSFSNCLKIQSVLDSNLITPNYKGVSWHCPNIGEVQRRYYDKSANNYVTRRLTSIQ